MVPEGIRAEHEHVERGGIGLGRVMKVLVLVVQDAVPYNELGVATSGATFFRSIGGSFGTAIFCAIFSNVLAGDLVHRLGHARLPTGLSAAGITPAILDKLPVAVHHDIAAACAHSIQTVFIVSAPIGALAFLAAWLIPQVELRRGIGTTQVPKRHRVQPAPRRRRLSLPLPGQSPATACDRSPATAPHPRSSLTFASDA
jgi:hypothetical protein